jgi:ribosomal protein RSM22 (predicted rRNA methylase)
MDEWGLSYSSINESLLRPFSSIRQASECVRFISDVLNYDRERIQEIYSDRELVSGYTLGHLLPSFAKAVRLLPKLLMHQNWNQSGVVDYGCGPGAISLALAKLIPDYHGHLELVDASELMLEQAEKVLIQLGGLDQVRVSKVQSSKLLAIDTDLILIGNMLNEIDIQDLTSWCTKLVFQGMVLIEPGTSTSFRKSLLFRDGLLEQRKYDVLFPCLSHRSCPLTEKDWCHQYVKIDYPSEFVDLYQQAKLNRDKLALTGFVFQQTKPKTREDDPEAHYGRLLRKPQKIKNGYTLLVCSSQNIEQKLLILKKDIDIHLRRKLKKALEGSLIRFRPGKVQNDRTLVEELDITLIESVKIG